VTAPSPPNIIVHVGPHKTGTTSIQEGLWKHQQRLAEVGLWYPVSVLEAHYPTCHSDLALALQRREIAVFEGWLALAWGDAQAAACGTLLLSSEEFSHPQTREALVGSLDGFCSSRGCEWRTVFVDRPMTDLVLSNLIHHLTIDVGRLTQSPQGVRSYAASVARYLMNTRAFFDALKSTFIPFQSLSREDFLADFVRETTTLRVDGITSPHLNSAEHHLADPYSWLTMTFRAMIATTSGMPMASPRVREAATKIIAQATLDDRAFRAVFDAFLDHARPQIELGVEDAMRAASKSSSRASAS
jgi:hypothetical protein